MRKTVLELYNINRDDVEMSAKWFDAKIKALSTKKLTPNRLMLEDGTKLTKRLVPGRMYFYYYDPKFKETLPYYDQFPLVLPYHATKDGFIGLNLHYLGYKDRFALFDQILKISSNKAYNETTKIRYTWELVKMAAQSKHVGACIKQYLVPHVKSPYFEIQPSEWYTAMMLPVQRFVGASKESVWSDSRRK